MSGVLRITAYVLMGITVTLAFSAAQAGYDASAVTVTAMVLCTLLLGSAAVADARRPEPPPPCRHPRWESVMVRWDPGVETEVGRVCVDCLQSIR